jgi:hypothetical protein
MAQTLKITPTRFIASGGKLDSNTRYMRKAAGTPDLKFIVSQNMDVSGGGLRYINGDGTAVDDSSYDGNFTGIASVGIVT